MSTLQFRRGVAANRSTVTPAVGEPAWSSDTRTLYVGDGTTAGGVPIVGSGGGGSSATTAVGGWYYDDLNDALHFVLDSGSAVLSLPGNREEWTFLPSNAACAFDAAGNLHLTF